MLPDLGGCFKDFFSSQLEMLNFSSKSQSDLVALSEFSDTCIGAKPGFNRWFTVGKIIITKFCCLGPVFEAGPFMFVDDMQLYISLGNSVRKCALFWGPGEFQ